MENPDGVMIGLEVHVQLNKLRTKIFCGCTTGYHADAPNTHTCPVCLGLPGSLPVVNKKAVEFAIKVGLALNCTVQEFTQFYRKNYYYPDLPKDFQITQYDFPISMNGYVTIEGEDGELKVRIRRAHLEEDPGRLVHEGTIEKSKFTLVDYNRSGMALLEIVTEPDLRSPKEARRFLDKLRSTLDYLDVFDGDLEGAMRVDANISLAGGSRAEIKNISSHKGAERALLYEIVRQKNVLRRGGTVVQETRHFDEAREITISMRTKEEAEDYRYFPEPDLAPLKVAEWAPDIKTKLPELPDERRLRFIKQYDITDDQAKSLTVELVWADYYEDVIKKHEKEYGEKLDPKFAAAWINDYLKGEMNYRNETLTYTVEKVKHYIIYPEYTVAILGFLNSKKITDDNAVFIFRKLLDHTKGGEYFRPVRNAADSAEKYIINSLEEKGLLKVEGDIVEAAALEAIAENPQAVADYMAGKEKALNALVGKVIKKANGRTDAQTVRTILLERLKSGLEISVGSIKNQEKDDLKKAFDKLSSEFTDKRDVVERKIIVKKLGNIGSKIDDFNFLINKLRNGSVGDRVGASASFRILLTKEAFDDLLFNMHYNEKGGSFVRYRAAEALTAYFTGNKLELNEIKKLKIALINQKDLEKNNSVSKLIDKILSDINP